MTSQSFFFFLITRLLLLSVRQERPVGALAAFFSNIWLFAFKILQQVTAFNTECEALCEILL